MSKFKVGDRVRLVRRPDDITGGPVPTTGMVVKICTPTWLIVDFDNWAGGWGDGACRYGVDPSNLEHVSASSPAKFQVVYVEDGDETFDTQEAAEAAAYDLAHNEPGSKFAVFKRIATATTGVVEIERFA